VLDTLGFVVWNLGTRSPATLLRDVVATFKSRRGLATGLLSALVGAIFLTAGTVMLVPAIVDPPVDFAPTELFAFLVALALEHVVGNDVRAFLRLQKS